VGRYGSPRTPTPAASPSRSAHAPAVVRGATGTRHLTQSPAQLDPNWIQTGAQVCNRSPRAWRPDAAVQTTSLRSLDARQHAQSAIQSLPALRRSALRRRACNAHRASASRCIDSHSGARTMRPIDACGTTREVRRRIAAMSDALRRPDAIAPAGEYRRRVGETIPPLRTLAQHGPPGSALRASRRRLGNSFP